jgi:ATP-dependent exoDNAse (exonuclease V) beta subunit
VDEFQDTSGNQIHLPDRLTAGWSDGDGRSLFLVGDPMQSIYRFRKAEVSLFIDAWNGRLFRQIQLQRLRLSVNFRSTKPIVDWVNRAFPLVMPDHNDAVLGAVRYSAASTSPGVVNHGEVVIQVLPGRDDEEEARRVIEVIRKCDMDESIAILVRSRSHASEILAALDKLKQRESRFRYKAIDFTPLAETTVIRDLVSLTLALLQPADRLAWLALLRTPFIGMDLADLDELVGGDAGNIILDAIMEATTGELPTLGVDGHQRLERCGPLLLAGVNLRGRQTVRLVVESTWISLGGPACVQNNSELDDSATYFDLLDALQAENLPIDRDTLDQRMAKLYAQPDADASGDLQVLTIYAAKGLQFDTVIVPALNRATAGDKPRLLHWFELVDEDKIVLSPMRNSAEKEQQKKSGDLIKFINNIEKNRQRLENGRLLYVASTRAVHSLHLFAAIKPGAKGEIKPQSSTLMAGLWPAIEAEHTPLITLAAEKLQQAQADHADVKGEVDAASLNLTQDYRRLASDWRLPALPASVKVNVVDAIESQDYVEFSWAGEDARLAGNLVHRLLQLIGDHGVDRWETNGGTAYYTHWCHQQLACEGVRETKAASITTAVLSAVENCLASRQGQWILQNHEDAHCEYAITAVLDEQARNLVLDRTFIADNTRWIIDYKTSSHGGGDLEGFLKNEAKRYRDQLRRYKQAMAITETRPIRTALYFPLLDRLVEP